MSERVNNASHTPAVHLAYGDDRGCASIHCTLVNSVRMGNRQDHPNGAAAKRLRTEIVVLRRFIAQPELRALNRKPGHHGPVEGINAEDLSRAKRCFVKFHGFGALPDGKPGSNRALK